MSRVPAAAGTTVRSGAGVETDGGTRSGAGGAGLNAAGAGVSRTENAASSRSKYSSVVPPVRGGAAATAAASGAGDDAPAVSGLRPAISSFTRLITICGSNGFTSTPSHRTARARPSSIGSKAPVSSSTGMCDSSGVSLMNAATS